MLGGNLGSLLYGDVSVMMYLDLRFSAMSFMFSFILCLYSLSNNRLLLSLKYPGHLLYTFESIDNVTIL